MPSASQDRTALATARALARAPVSAITLRQALGRRLLRRGHQAAAQAVTQERDGLVLSGVGMFAAAMSVPVQSRNPLATLARVRALAGVGRHDEALALASTACAAWPRLERALLELVLQAPAAGTVPSIQAHPDFAGAILHGQGQLDAAWALVEQAPRNPVINWLRISILRRMARHERANHELADQFAANDLRPVVYAPDCIGIHGFSAVQPASAISGEGPLISVIMPAYNVERWVRTAIESVLAQDHANLELLVVNDGSTDATAQVARQLAVRDARVHVLDLAVSRGPYAARNAGLARARGDIITFHDGDDWSHPQKLAVQLRALLDVPERMATLSDWVRVDDEGGFYARQRYPFLRLNTSSIMFRAHPVMRDVGLFDEVRSGADSEHLWRIALRYGPRSVHRLKLPLSFGGHRSDSLTNAIDTGFRSREGARLRLDYWEAWRRWHAQVFVSGDARALHLSGVDRPFNVPVELRPPPAG